jgi:hypothetical protein
MIAEKCFALDNEQNMAMLRKCGYLTLETTIKISAKDPACRIQTLLITSYIPSK